MTGSGKLAATLVSAGFLLLALGAPAQQSSPAPPAAQSETPVAPVMTAKRAPADMPPNPPKITCEGGQLTISAQNSTLLAVMNAIGACFGSQIDVPAAARADRVFTESGPGPLRAVLADFLSSTDFNFVIKALPTDPQKVQMVLLDPRPADSQKDVATVADNLPAMTPNRRGWVQARENYMQSFNANQEDSSQPADTTSSAVAPPDTEPAPAAPATSGTPAPATPGTPAPADANAPAATPVPPGTDPAVPPSGSAPVPSPAANPVTTPQAGSDNSPAQGKGTQDMISNMQRMFEQRKQMTQQQQQAASPQNP